MKKAISNKKITVYCCGIDWQHELGEALGGNKVYSSVKDLKKYHEHWEQCGIVQLEIKGIKWVEPQDLYKDLKFGSS